MSRRHGSTEDDSIAEPVAKGFIRAWLAAKLAPIVVRVAAWTAWLAAIAAYAGYVAWKVRRLAKEGTLDEPTTGGPPTPVSAKEHGVFAWIRGNEPTPTTDPSRDTWPAM